MTFQEYEFKKRHEYIPGIFNNSQSISTQSKIVAFEIEITSIEHVFKLSQNRDQKSYENIIQHLHQGDEDAKAVGVIMNERQDKVFPK